MPETVKVRVPITVGPDGSWYACGSGGEGINYARSGEAYYILIAELKVPKLPEVVASVERVEGM